MPLFQSEIQLVMMLEAEWESVLRSLPREVDRSGLGRPVFAVNPEMACWGRWRGGACQTLELSADLVWNHPWYSVCEVLRHEMAHQLQEFLFPNALESDHGPCFRRCCRLLGANPAASGTNRLTDQIVFADGDDGAAGSPGRTERQKIAGRIHKLLALSRSSNPHEAEAAFLKARELMQKHQLESLGEDGGGEDGFYCITLGKAARRHRFTENVVAGILNEFYNVRSIWTFVPAAEGALGHRRILAIYGKAVDLRIASYVYDSLHAVMERHWSLHKDEFRARPARSAKDDFTLGLLLGFSEALRKQPVPPGMQALIRVQGRALDEFFAWRNPSVRSGGSARRRYDPRIRDCGRRIGLGLSLPKGLDDRPAAAPLHLTWTPGDGGRGGGGGQ